MSKKVQVDFGNFRVGIDFFRVGPPPLFNMQHSKDIH